MSNRTLIEINHDYAGEINKNKLKFLDALNEYLRAIPYGKIPYEIFPGVRVLGARHHSEAVDIAFGAYRRSEPKT